MDIFIDTSGFLAVLNRDEERHQEAVTGWRKILAGEEQLVTSNYVLVETCALLQNRMGLAAIRIFQQDVVPVLRLSWVDAALHKAAVNELLAAGRKKLSLVDCASFAIMRKLAITTAFTLDKHFREQGFECYPT